MSGIRSAFAVPHLGQRMMQSMIGGAAPLFGDGGRQHALILMTSIGDSGSFAESRVVGVARNCSD
ncbi:MAG TPA: hypothetical protein VL048_11245 [Xanthobacteraceae bacterium]|nr:hypothetical protein [Xanthobacteraceae bacterium]